MRAVCRPARSTCGTSEQLKARAVVDPFSTPTPADVPAFGAVLASRDRASRGSTCPGAVGHGSRQVGQAQPAADAAYCRWRGAQVALATDQGTIALRLLRRATREAREHVPLSAAIAETTDKARRTPQKR